MWYIDTCQCFEDKEGEGEGAGEGIRGRGRKEKKEEEEEAAMKEEEEAKGIKENGGGEEKEAYQGGRCWRTIGTTASVHAPLAGRRLVGPN